MRKTLFKNFIVFSLTLFVCISINAAELKFEGSIGYKFDNDKVTIFAGKIMNKAKGGKSGSIKVALYATDSLYQAGGLYGYVLGEHTFDKQLYGEYQLLDIQQSMEYIEPPVGKYYITVALLEYDGNEYKLTDFESFKNPVTFGLHAEMQKLIEEQKKKELELAQKNEEKKIEEKKKKELEYSFKDDLTTQTLLTVMILGGLRHILSVP
jgi:hypothetical protein